MCYKVILRNGGILMFNSERYKDQNMYNKAADNYPHALRSVPDCHKTKKCVIKLSVFIRLQHNLFLIDLKFVLDWFVTNEIIEKLDGALFFDDYIIFADLDSDFVIFFSEDLGSNSVILGNINLDDEHFDYCDSETINHVRLMSWYDKYKQRKVSKKEVDEELPPVAWYPKRG